MGSLTIILAMSGQLSLACINTTYSREDELVITDDLGHLIIGAFAHHGEAFYKKEVERCLAILTEKPDDFDARNDLGAAYTKLRQWDKAKAAFEENERRHPGEYKTASNLGVMYKKMKKYDEAAKWIAKALEIKPGGHMGLGDYYLKMIEWRNEVKKNRGDMPENMRERDPKRLTNFLGVRYDSGPEATASVANREYVITLIKNDVAFGDAYIVLGDILFVEQNYQLALRAYMRAQDLKNYYGSDRRERIAKVWREQSQPGYVLEEALGNEQIHREFNAAEHWLEQYKRVESQRLEEGLGVTFVEMQTAMAEHGISKPKIVEAAYYQGTEETDPAFGKSITRTWNATIAGGLVLLVLAGIGCLVMLRLLLHNPKPPIEWTSELKSHPVSKSDV